ncbi:MAG: hypothetical protein M0R17_01090 [Candidatus Omnitrophica bacterium]|jgi:hypothetical protein|nr:hypothetical protein [Candidatus Omnitrophota bacterium]
MKARIKDNAESQAKELPFPKLMKDAKSDLIVLMTAIDIRSNRDLSRGMGVVIIPNKYHAIGEAGQNWIMESFEDLASNVTIELNND